MHNLNPRRIAAFWDDGSKDPFTTFMRIALYVAYFSAILGIALSGGTGLRSSGEWWQMLGFTLYILGMCFILIGHVLLGYAVYRRQKQFQSPDHAARNLFKSLFLYMYLPAFIITILIVTPAILMAL